MSGSLRWSRRCNGDSTAARDRQAATTLGATSANSPSGRPIARTASSREISVSIEARLTLPVAALISASSPGSASLSPSPSSALTRASSRARTSPGSRPEIRETRVFSAWRRPERTILSTRSGVGGSIDRDRSSASSASLTSS